MERIACKIAAIKRERVNATSLLLPPSSDMSSVDSEMLSKSVNADEELDIESSSHDEPRKMSDCLSDQLVASEFAPKH